MHSSSAESSRQARFIWIDCEMTGLNILEDELCEVGIVPTDGELTVLDKGFDLVIRPSQHAEDQMNDVVRAMHSRSGLIEQWHTSGVDLETAQQQVVSYVEQFLPSEAKALLAGNSVGSDKKFLDRYMPQLMEQLHYRVIDVSTFKELARLWYPTVFVNRPQKKEGHRALADIIESIDELRYYRSSMLAQRDLSQKDAQAMAQLIEATSLASQ